MSKIFISIDSSTSCSGIAVLEKNGKIIKLLECINFYPSEKDIFQKKCIDTYNFILTYIDKYKDNELTVSIELLNSMKNMNTVRKLAALWGFIICSLLKDRGIRVYSINTMTAKKEMTGIGNADKEQVMKCVNSMFKTKLLYSNTKGKSDDDKSDAIAVGVATIRLLNKGVVLE